MNAISILDPSQICSLLSLSSTPSKDSVYEIQENKKFQIFSVNKNILYTVNSNDEILLINMNNHLCPTKIISCSPYLKSIHEIFINSNGQYLVAIGDGDVVIFETSKIEEDLFFSEFSSLLLDDKNRERLVFSDQIKRLDHSKMGSDRKWSVLKAVFHPLSPQHLVILCDDNKLRIYNLRVSTDNIIENEQLFCLENYHRGVDGEKIQCISFCFGSSKFVSWLSFSVFLLYEDTDIVTLSPLFPLGSVLPTRTLYLLKNKLLNENDKKYKYIINWIDTLVCTSSEIKQNNKMASSNLKHSILKSPEIPLFLIPQSTKLIRKNLDLKFDANTPFDINYFEYNSLPFLLLSFRSGHVFMILINNQVKPQSSRSANEISRDVNTWIIYEILNLKNTNGKIFHYLRQPIKKEYSEDDYYEDGNNNKNNNNNDDNSFNCGFFDSDGSTEYLNFYSSHGLWEIYLPWISELDLINIGELEPKSLQPSEINLIETYSILGVAWMEYNNRLIGMILSTQKDRRRLIKFSPFDLDLDENRDNESPLSKLNEIISRLNRTKRILNVEKEISLSESQNKEIRDLIVRFNDDFRLVNQNIPNISYDCIANQCNNEKIAVILKSQAQKIDSFHECIMDLEDITTDISQKQIQLNRDRVNLKNKIKKILDERKNIETKLNQSIKSHLELSSRCALLLKKFSCLRVTNAEKKFIYEMKKISESIKDLSFNINQTSYEDYEKEVENLSLTPRGNNDVKSVLNLLENDEKCIKIMNSKLKILGEIIS